MAILLAVFKQSLLVEEREPTEREGEREQEDIEDKDDRGVSECR